MPGFELWWSKSKLLFPGIEQFWCLYYKQVRIVNDDPSIISKWSFKLIDDNRVIIYNCNWFIIQATGICLISIEYPVRSYQNMAWNWHDWNPRFSKSLSCLKIYYSRLTLIISRLLKINTMLPTHKNGTGGTGTETFCSRPVVCLDFRSCLAWKYWTFNP